MTAQRHQFFGVQPSLWSNSHYWKTIALTTWNFVSQVMSLFFNILCHSFSFKEQVSFSFMAAVTICSAFGAQNIKSLTVSIVFPSICHEVMGTNAVIFFFEC